MKKNVGNETIDTSDLHSLDMTRRNQLAGLGPTKGNVLPGTFSPRYPPPGLQKRQPGAPPNHSDPDTNPQRQTDVPRPIQDIAQSSAARGPAAPSATARGPRMGVSGVAGDVLGRLEGLPVTVHEVPTPRPPVVPDVAAAPAQPPASPSQARTNHSPRVQRRPNLSSVPETSAECNNTTVGNFSPMSDRAMASTMRNTSKLSLAGALAEVGDNHHLDHLQPGGQGEVSIIQAGSQGLAVEDMQK